VAPSKTPRQSARDSKTDQLDAKTLAKYAAKGLLRPIAIPTRRQEADRQLTRTRDQLVSKQSEVKLQIKSFLLQHGIDQPPAVRAWSANAARALDALKLSKQLRLCLDLLVQELQFLQDQLTTMEEQLKQTFDNDDRHTRQVALLKTHPGVGPVIAKQYTAELFKPKRFKRVTEVAKYVGLAPAIIQSGQSYRDGPVTKTGRPQLRSNLIQGAWVWVTKDRRAHITFLRILHNTGNKDKAITAMARRLTVHLWKMLCDNKPFTNIA
jgi:transposase